MNDFIAKMQRVQEMKTKFTNAVGSTRLRRVQFGVPPNCRGERTINIDRTNNGKLRSQKVSGATPETTRETRVLPHIFPRRLLARERSCALH
jgi:hypothetical protein